MSEALRVPLRGSLRGSMSSLDRPTPLRRPFGIRRRTKSGVAGLLAAAALRALLVVALPVGLVVWLLYSPYFLIREVEVDPGARVSAAWMRQNLAPLVGRHVLAVSLEGVRRRLSAHPWVASVELRRELPDRLRVSVVERQPVALLATEGGLAYLDGEGLPITAVVPGGVPDGRAQGPPLRPNVGGAPVHRIGGDTPPRPNGGDAADSIVRAGPVPALSESVPTPPTGLVVVHYHGTGPVPVQAVLDLVAELRRAQPTWGLGVREVEVLGEREYRVVTSALAYPLLLEAGTVGPAVTNLQLMLPHIERRVTAVGEADLRSPRRLVIRPTTNRDATSNATPEMNLGSHPHRRELAGGH